MTYGTFVIHRPDGNLIEEDAPTPMQFLAELFSDKYPEHVRPSILASLNHLEIGESFRLPGNDGYFAIITRTA